ncbi:MAG: hypothetical protein ACRD3O_10020, partial [Terriglobia bacterium]
IQFRIRNAFSLVNYFLRKSFFRLAISKYYAMLSDGSTGGDVLARRSMGWATSLTAGGEATPPNSI